MLSYLLLLDTKDEKENFTLLYETYHRQLYFVAFSILNDKHLAEDMVHDTFIKLTTHMDKIDFSIYPILKDFQEEQKKTSSFYFTDYLKKIEEKNKKVCHKTWSYLVTILKNHIYNKYSKDKKLIFCDDSEMMEQETQENSMEYLIRQENEEQIRECLEQLPFLYRQVLVLQYYHEYTPAQIGEILDKSADNIRHISMRAKDKLRKMVEEDFS